MTNTNWPDRVQSLQEASLSDNTNRIYASGIRRFTGWCSDRGNCFLPAEPIVVAEFLADLVAAGLQWSSVGVNAAAIAHLHVCSGEDNPCKSYIVSAVLRGARRRRGGYVNKKQALPARILTEVLEVIPNDLKGARDRAMLTLGFAGALRRSELADLRVEDVVFTPEGAVLTIKRSKTDFAGRGAQVAVPNGRHFQPVTALQEWLSGAEIVSGPIIRPMARGKVICRRIEPVMISRTLKRYLRLAGYNPQHFGAHSLRAGFITEAAEAGMNAERIMDHSRHTDPKAVRGYIRRANLFRDHAGDSFL